MPALGPADNIRILVATDSHVGYEERDPIRKDDSWKSFHEVMCLAKEQDVDMVLLAGDLFHDNKPSRKAMYQVMRSLRMNCLGEKPCELEMLSDASEVFEGAFTHVNYEDPDINVAIPVFSIHGNHDDPSGDGHFSSLDLLQVSGLLNYYGRTPESDNIAVKPILLQKGQTKLALYGMSNVRDERLFRTFRDGKVKFFRPNVQQDDWFNIMAVHQNHHAHSETGYLPENFLPEFLDLVVWGHEHECLIDPTLNSETMFHVMQPGSSVATSLIPGEAVPKHVAIVNVTGREFKVEKHRIKTVRPFICRELVLSEDRRFRGLDKKQDNKHDLTKKLMEVVEEMIEEAKAEWFGIQDHVDDDEPIEVPLPLVRLKVEYTAPEGGRYDCENPQRFSNRFVGKVANVNDVIQFHRRKRGGTKKNDKADLPEESTLASLAIDNVKVEKLVKEFLNAQSLKILPQAPFGDAVSQFVDKDDKHAMEVFVDQSLEGQVKTLLSLDDNDEDLDSAMAQYAAELDKAFHEGTFKRKRIGKLKPRPDEWDSDFNGEWEDQPGAYELTDDDGSTPAPTSRRGRAATDDVNEDDDDDASVAAAPAKRAPAKRATAKAAPKKAPAKVPAKKAAPAVKKPAARGRPKANTGAFIDDSDEDVIMLDDEPEPTPAPRAQPKQTAAAPARATRQMQSQLNFSQASRPATQMQTATRARGVSVAKASQRTELSDDEISDDDDDNDAFAPVMRSSRRR